MAPNRRERSPRRRRHSTADECLQRCVRVEVILFCRTTLWPRLVLGSGSVSSVMSWTGDEEEWVPGGEGRRRMTVSTGQRGVACRQADETTCTCRGMVG